MVPVQTHPRGSVYQWLERKCGDLVNNKNKQRPELVTKRRDGLLKTAELKEECMSEVIVKVRESELSQEGKMLLDTVRRQSRCYGVSELREGLVEVVLYDQEDSDDVITVLLKDRLDWVTRARIYGMIGLSRNQWSGKMGLAAPIPTETYIEAMVRMHGHSPKPPFQIWHVPYDIVQRVRRKELTGVQAVNAAGEDLLRFCAEGQFDIY